MKEITVPMRTFWLPRFKIINKKIRVLRGNSILITPVSISYMKLGNMSKKEDKIYVDVIVKSFTLLNLPNFILRLLCFLILLKLFIDLIEVLKWL